MSKTIRKVFNKYKTSSTKGLAIHESDAEGKFDREWLEKCDTCSDYCM